MERLTRRGLLTVGGVVFGGAVLAACSGSEAGPVPATPTRTPVLTPLPTFAEKSTSTVSTAVSTFPIATNASPNPEVSEQAKKKEFERLHTLGLESSSLSKSGWIIHYARYDRTANYTFHDSKEIKVANGGIIDFNPLIPLEGNTNIRIVAYLRSDGQTVMSLDVLGKNGEVEKWILRNTVTDDPEIDSRAVIFQSGGLRPETRREAIMMQGDISPQFTLRQVDLEAAR